MDSVVPTVSRHSDILYRRRRIKTEEKAKVVVSVWGGGDEYIQFFAALAILPRTIWIIG